MRLAVSKVGRLVQLVDLALVAAQEERSSAASSGKAWLVEDCELFITNLHKIREQAVSGCLRASEGAGLGITRALSEWEVSAELYTAGYNLEAYYQDEYGA